MGKRTRKLYWPLSTASKLVWSSVCLNFGTSGGRNCDISCKLHPRNPDPDKGGKCYSDRLERMRPTVRAKLTKVSRSPLAGLCGAMVAQLRLESVNCPFAWIRFSSAGSVPRIQDLRGRGNQQARRAFLALVRACVDLVGPNRIHFPVESGSKATYYRRLLSGLGVVVRRSCQDLAEWTTERGAASYVVTGPDRAAKLRAAREAMDLRQAKTGRKSIICPAIVGDSSCGKCTACACPLVDVVYLSH